jgi:hypothetical protein
MAGKITAATSGYTYEAKTDLVVLECPTCHITYAIPARLHEQAEKYNRAEWPNNTLGWYCPSGHYLSFPGKNEEQLLRDRLEAEKNERARVASERDQAEASAKAQRGAATRARNERDASRRRHAAGVCPCCGRTFKQLQRHMASKHPDYEVPS